MSQMVKIPEDKTSLVFSYDFVSEEPSEFVGTIYNDTFAVQIISDSGTETILKNDVNSAEWHEIDGIDFDGGDFTTYHTQWRNVTCDLSSIRDKLSAFALWSMIRAILFTIQLYFWMV